MTSTPGSSTGFDLGDLGTGWYEVDGDDFDELYYEGSSDTLRVETYGKDDASARVRYFVRQALLED